MADRKTPSLEPRYDDVFFEGLARLNEGDFHIPSPVELASGAPFLVMTLGEMRPWWPPCPHCHQPDDVCECGR